MGENELPADYEPCAECGMDHAYDYPFAGARIEQCHEATDMPEDDCNG